MPLLPFLFLSHLCAKPFKQTASLFLHPPLALNFLPDALPDNTTFLFPTSSLKKKVHGQKSTNWQREVAGNTEGKWAIKIPGQVKYGRNSSQTLNGIGSTPKLSCLVPK